MASEGLIVLQCPDTAVETRPTATVDRNFVWPSGEDSQSRNFFSAGKPLASSGCSGFALRELAHAAKVILGALICHSGGIRTLYYETIFWFIDDIGPVFTPIIRQLSKVVGRATIDREALEDYVENFLRGSLADGFSASRLSPALARVFT